ncbi:MAG: T9SS type A sorting domain-containing protein [bacterium]|nr:MAG: T9SS type A sorting domain-containing protein [bacterium]
MNRFGSTLVALAVIVSLVIIPSPRADWVYNGVPVTMAIDGQLQQCMVSDGAGGAIIAWQDQRNKSVTSQDIYAQRIDGSGDVRWTLNGIVICDTLGYQYAPDIVTDMMGGAIIVWQDERVQHNYDIYAQRVDSDGNVLWIMDGVQLTAAPDDQAQCRITTDGLGGGIVVWQDYETVYGQRVDYAGLTHWGGNGTPLTYSPAETAHPRIVSDDNNGAYIVWADERAGNTEDDIYMQRIDGGGGIYWSGSGVPVCTAPGSQYVEGSPLHAGGGSGGAIMAWTDERAGESWAPMNVGLGDMTVRALRKTNEYYFAGAGNMVYRSENYGDTWEAFGTGLPSMPVMALTSQQISGSLAYVFAGTQGGGIYRTTDDTNNWVPKNAGLTNSQVLALDSDWDYIYAGTNGGGMYRSPDYGETWQQINNGLGMLCVMAVHISGDRIYAGTCGGGIYRSTDYGDTWVPINTGLGNLFIQAIYYASPEGYLFVGTDGGGIYRSSDYGDSWSPANNGLGHYDVNALTYNYHRYHLFAGTNGSGVYKSEDAGDTWVAVNTGLGNQYVLTLDYRKYHIVHAGTDGGGIYRYSMNRDIYVQHINTGGGPEWTLDGVAVCTAVGNQDLVRTAGGGGGGGCIIVWCDERDGLSMADIYAQRVDATGTVRWASNGIPICTAQGTQTDPQIVPDGLGGAIITWADYRSGSDADVFAQRIDIDGNILWSTDGVPVCIRELNQYDPQLVPDDAGGVIISWAHNDNSMVSTFDIWAQRITADGDIPIATLLQGFTASINGRNVILRWTLSKTLPGMDFTIARAEDSGGNFIELAGAEIACEGRSFAFTDRDTEPARSYRYQVATLDTDGTSMPLFETGPVRTPAASLTLYQNYPNPFNPVTAIRYHLPEDSGVTLDIYDTAGRRIARIAEGIQEKGDHTARWDGLDVHGRSCASGVYFYKLTVGKEILTRKMILMR